MERLYILDPQNFKGQIVNTMSSNEGTPKFVDYMEEPTTLEEYKKIKGNENLIAIDWETFEKEYYTPHLNSLCEPFKKTTKERFWDGLECLPPKRWTKGTNSEFFFVGECYTDNLYTCYVRKGEDYYTALRPINTDANELFNLK
jgi:hypothetical protein